MYVLITCFNEFWNYESWFFFIVSEKISFSVKNKSYIGILKKRSIKHRSKQEANFMERIQVLYIQDSWKHVMNSL